MPTLFGMIEAVHLLKIANFNFLRVQAISVLQVIYGFYDCNCRAGVFPRSGLAETSGYFPKLTNQ